MQKTVDMKGEKKMKTMKKSLTQAVSLALVLTLSALPMKAAAATYASPVNGNYVLINKASGKALDVYGDYVRDKSNIQIWTEVKNSKTQLFTVQKSSGSQYIIASAVKPNLVVNQYSYRPAANTNVNLYHKDGADNTQSWYFQEVKGGYYAILSAYNPKLALSSVSSKNMANVCLQTYSGKNTQLWQLKPAEPPKKGYTDADVKAAVACVGKQTDNKTLFGRACAAVAVSYVRYLYTGVSYSPLQSTVGGGSVAANFGLVGSVKTARGAGNFYKTLKQTIDSGNVAIAHVFSKGGADEHWILVYRYDGDGTSAHSFYIADPWDGRCGRLDSFNYSQHSDGRVVVCG